VNDVNIEWYAVWVIVREENSSGKRTQGEVEEYCWRRTPAWRANTRIAIHEVSPDCSQVPCTAKSGWGDDEKDGLLAPKLTLAKEHDA